MPNYTEDLYATAELREANLHLHHIRRGINLIASLLLAILIAVIFVGVVA